MVEIHDHRKLVSANEPSNNRFSVDGSRDSRADDSLFYLREGGRYGFYQTRFRSRSQLTTDDVKTSPDGVEIYRIIMRPSAESLWNDLRMMDAKMGGVWSDEDALRIESQIVNLTAPPLCLTPDPHVSRMANWIQSSTMPSPAYPTSATLQPQRRDKATGHKLNSVELAQAKSQDVRREQIMLMMKDGWSSELELSRMRDITSETGSFVPSFSRLDFLRTWRSNRKEEGTGSSETMTSPSQADTAKSADAKKAAKKKKRIKGRDEPDTPTIKTTEAATAAATDASRSKPKRRKKDESSTDEMPTAKAGASHMTASTSSPFEGHVSLPGRPFGTDMAMANTKSDNLVLPGSGAAKGATTQGHATPGMPVIMPSSTPFAPPTSDQKNNNHWFFS